MRLYNEGMQVGRIIGIQAGIGRTRTGRDIGSKVIDAILGLGATVEQMTPEDAMDCRNCHLIMPKEYFASGCPNCGSKDIDNCIETEQVKKAVGT